MTKMTMTGARVHPATEIYVADLKAGKISRREFMARTTAMGVTAAGAYALAGLEAPAQAAAHIAPGGTMRMQMEVRALKDPRTMDWSQIAFVTSGWLEYLAMYNNDGTFSPMLLESWEVNDDATEYRLNVRQGVTWNDGQEFTAQDVADVMAYWAEADVEGNSMAARLGGLVDPETNRLADGAVTVDGNTVVLSLPSPDITLIAGFTDYPAAVVRASDFDPDTFGDTQIGTGPFKLDSLDVGVKATLSINEDHNWWGSEMGMGPNIEAMEYIDYGTDPSAWVAAADSGEVDMLYETVGDFVDVMTGIGWEESEVVSAATIVIRPNQEAEVDGMQPYADKRVRQALAMAVDNQVCLELGYADRGVVAENHHACPVHPAYDPTQSRLPYDPARAMELMEEAGMADYTHELLSIDDDWRRNTTDAVAAQLRDAGFSVERTILPGSTFWNDWVKYPFSSTNWNHRPLEVQIWGLAYKSGVAWNEFGFSNEEFDTLLAEANSIADADARREVAGRMQAILVEEGVTIQPYWRSLYRHTAPNVVNGGQHIAYMPRMWEYGFAA
ncbi:MAG: ABC transporter substrate-binding protein [Paracoccaceae bacterium]